MKKKDKVRLAALRLFNRFPELDLAEIAQIGDLEISSARLLKDQIIRAPKLKAMEALKQLFDITGSMESLKLVHLFKLDKQTILFNPKFISLNEIIRL